MAERIYFAPLEGITDGVFRRVHHDFFPGIDRYFIPFVSPTAKLTFSSREQRAISPQENAGIPVVVQILTRVPEDFVRMSILLRDVGYDEINLNLGCPSGTVTAKGKGSAMLRDPDTLRAFFDVACAKSALPISVKTRIGWEDASEWPAIRDVFRDYPICSLIIHARTRREGYDGTPHRDACGERIGEIPIAYNGDIRTRQDCQDVLAELPNVHDVMIGRGLIANPALAREIRGGDALTKDTLRAFHDALLQSYLERWPANAVTGHMREIMRHVLTNLQVTPKLQKKLRKADRIDDYRRVTDEIFETGTLP